MCSGSERESNIELYETRTFATSNRLVFESVARFRLKCTDRQYDMMASSVKPNADRVNARYKYACKF